MFDAFQLRHYLSIGIRVFSVDSRKDVFKRDFFMPLYIEKLFRSGQCQHASIFVGKGHLIPIKNSLHEKGISAITERARSLECL